jgi:hypothetical protein
MSVFDGLKRWRRRDRRSRAELQFGAIMPSLATKLLDRPPSEKLHAERIAAVSTHRHARNVDIMASCKIKRKARRRRDCEMKI